ncbi:MAG: hypothetical protein PHX18_07320 [Candidatus Gastranaerophilales bacterium]|nr:hypothetical protein [Candidatus Gastranaerophilales bacterium]
MKKSLGLVLILVCTNLLTGSGYVGELPELLPVPNKMQPDMPAQEAVDAFEILPLDKLTIPPEFKPSLIKDSEYEQYEKDVAEIRRLLEKIKQITDEDKSVKYFVASSNTLNLTVSDFKRKYKHKKYFRTYKVISDVNDDSQTMRDYWYDINKNQQFVSYYKTKGSYSEAALNQSLAKFSKILEYAIRELKRTE